MSQKLNKNYKESGTEREKLIQILEDMDSRTVDFFRCNGKTF